MSFRQLFMPGVTITHDVKPASSTVALARQGGNVRVVNDSKVRVWIEYGGPDARAAPEDSMLIMPGYTAMMRVPPRATHMAAVCPVKGTASLNITFGEGS
jgi:hypothetical protein